MHDGAWWYTRTFLGSIFFVIGIVAGALFIGAWENNPVKSYITREGGYLFINPLLSCDISEDAPYPGFSRMEGELERAVSASLENNDIERISVYVRDMNSGLWVGVHVDDRYAPASLMKVPLLISYLKDAETNPSVLTRTVSLQSIDSPADQQYPPTRSLIAGANYSVNTLLQLMIQESDNQAAQTLNASVNEKIMTDVYDNFGSPRAFDETKDLVSPKVYMRFFRILYNASYLTRVSSQQALGLLSKTKFTEGLVVGIPKDRTIVHKFGERTVLNKDPITGALTVKNHELHDCGIVYYPQKPYGICIMTEGKDFTALAKVIAEISRVTYEGVDAGFLTYNP